MRPAALFLLLSTTTFAAQPTEEEVKKELKLFEGKWIATFVQPPDGTPYSEEIVKETFLEVNGDKFVLKQPGQEPLEAKFKVDPTKKIKTIDIYDLNDATKLLVQGIYEIKGDTRRSCFAELGKDRPEAFTKEKGYLILEWKKAK